MGGATYLASIIETIPAAPNVRHYAEIVHHKSRLRKLIKSTNDIIKRCYEQPTPVDDIVAFAETAIFKIAEDRTQPAFYQIGKIISSNFDTLKNNMNKSLLTGVPTGFSKSDRASPPGYNPRT